MCTYSRGYKVNMCILSDVKVNVMPDVVRMSRHMPFSMQMAPCSDRASLTGTLAQLPENGDSVCVGGGGGGKGEAAGVGVRVCDSHACSMDQACMWHHARRKHHSLIHCCPFFPSE